MCEFWEIVFYNFCVQKMLIFRLFLINDFWFLPLHTYACSHKIKSGVLLVNFEIGRRVRTRSAAQYIKIFVQILPNNMPYIMYIFHRKPDFYNKAKITRNSIKTFRITVFHHDCVQRYLFGHKRTLNVTFFTIYFIVNLPALRRHIENLITILPTFLISV